MFTYFHTSFVENPIFCSEKRPKNAFFVPKRDEKGVFPPKGGGETTSGTQNGLWIFNVYDVKNCPNGE
ncbi:MAG: hypothetical protein LBV32_03235 [Tannerellaceae bacterium]|jgi:hypothetical protein|nr:hypothetical protein [Tannerellaceae bacterium]